MYSALIIGAGQIAGGYDNPSDNDILTHAHAYENSKNIELLGFYDINIEQAKKMASKWDSKAIEDLDEVKSIDVVSICTPNSFHLKSVQDALKLNPKVIFLEKPVSDNLKDAQEIYEISKKVPVLVNFSRRFVKEFQELAKDIKTGKFGKYQTGSGFYGKGFIHNGSHMRNLMELFLGDIKKITILEEINDFFENDTTKTAILEFENDKKFFMQGCDCNKFSIFDFDLMFEKAKIRIINSGNNIEIYTVKENLIYKGYYSLCLNKSYPTELNFALQNAVSNIEEFITCGQKLISPVKVESGVLKWK